MRQETINNGANIPRHYSVVSLRSVDMKYSNDILYSVKRCDGEKASDMKAISLHY